MTGPGDPRRPDPRVGSAPLRDLTGRPVPPSRPPEGPARPPRPPRPPGEGETPTPAPPLLLLPLRLEYRVVQVGETLVRAHATLASPLRFRTEQLARQEVWFRWYPDDPFASETPPPPTARELILLQRFRAAVAASGAAWHDASNATVAEAWQRFAGDVGAYRALALVRGSVPDTPDDDAGLLLALPDTVQLYALTGSQLTVLGGGKPIQAGLRYTPQALRPGDWLTDFDQAVAAGMGARIGDGNAVQAALTADWIVAVGVRAGDRSDELEAHLRKAVIAGELEIVPQDSPTNNGPGRPTGYRYDPRDTLDVLRRSTWFERRGTAASATDADALAEALGISAEIAYAAPNASERDMEHAADMAAALVPGLVGTTFQWLPPEVATEADVVDLLVSSASARGPLPVVRLGRDPYGILPIAIPETLEAPATETAARNRAFEALRDLANTAVLAGLAHAGSVPIIRPGDTDVGERLASILRQLPVSCRLDLGEIADRAKTPKRLGCPLIEAEGWAPRVYLPSLLDAPPDAAAREDARARGAPLLWHLVELSWEAVQRELPQSVGSASARQLVSGTPGAAVPAETLARVRRYHDAVGRLAALDGQALGVLVFEVLDLLDHRADAWLTALATSRLRSQRTAGVAATELGYYGFLGRLRPEAATGASAGYVQAPSMAQAASAGLLRAAALRHGDGGPFAVRLTSTRVRSALRLLAGLRQGVPLAEQLGYQAERLLHDRDADVLIGEARSLFRLTQGTGTDVSQDRLCDGLAFAKAADARFASLPAGPRGIMRGVRDVLADHLDALSDVLVAEAVHQLSVGNTGAAQAWMQVLSGEPVPAALSFLRTRREGQATQYRVACVFEPGARQGSNPRVHAEPTLQALAAKLLPELPAAAVLMRVPRADGSPQELAFSLAADLGMDAVDLVLGGEREVTLRARQLLVRRWRKNSTLRAQLGPLPPSGLNEFLNQERPVVVLLAQGSPSVETLLARAKGCARVVSKARPLDAADLSAAAGPELALDEPTRAAHAAAGIEALEVRRKALLSAADSALAALDSSTADVEARSLEIRRRLAGGESREAVTPLLVAVDGARDALDDALLQAARFALPDALLPFATEELVDAADGWFAAFRRIRKALAEKRARLAEAAEAGAMAGSAASGERPLRSREAALRTLRDAIRYACDGDGFPVWPPFRHTAATAPPLDAAASAAAAVGAWAQLRPALRDAGTLAEQLALRAWQSRARATVRADDADPTHGRPVEERPLNEYAAVYLDQTGGPLDRPPNAQRTLAGFVIDEWSALRPSRMQGTALAVHYDAPQSEPPHVLLLGVAERAARAVWTADDAAALVRETIRLMQVRALPARVGSLRESVGQLFNVIPPDGGRARIPTRTRPLVVRPDGVLVVAVLEAGTPSPQRTGPTLLDRES